MRSPVSELRKRVSELAQEQHVQLDTLQRVDRGPSKRGSDGELDTAASATESRSLSAALGDVSPNISLSLGAHLDSLRAGQQRHADVVKQISFVAAGGGGDEEHGPARDKLANLVSQMMSVLASNHEASTRLLTALRPGSTCTTSLEEQIHELEDKARATALTSRNALSDAGSTMKMCEAAIAALVEENRQLREDNRQLLEARQHDLGTSDLDAAYRSLEDNRVEREELQRQLKSEQRRSQDLEHQCRAMDSRLATALSDLRSTRQDPAYRGASAVDVELRALRVANDALSAEVKTLREENHTLLQRVGDDTIESESRPLPQRSTARAATKDALAGTPSNSPSRSADYVLTMAHETVAAARTRAADRETRHRESINRLKQRRAELQAALNDGDALVHPAICCTADQTNKRTIDRDSQGIHVLVEEIRGQLEALDREEAALHKQHNAILQKRAAVSSTLMAQRNQKLMNGAPDADVESLNNDISSVMSKIDAATAHVDSNLARVHAKRDLLSRQLRNAERRLCSR